MKADLRRFTRVNLKAFAAVGAVKGDISKEYNAVCVNISEGGCCLELDVLISGPDIDFGIKIGVDLPDIAHRLIVDGKIIWLKEEDRDQVKKYLVGVEFHNLKPQDRQALRNFINNQSGIKNGRI